MAQDKITDFQDTILIHMDAAFNYAFWLTRNRHDAEDLTQESCQRAYAAYESFEKTNARAWLLTIVRHCYLNQQQKEKSRGDVVYLDALLADSKTPASLQHNDTPEQQILRQHEKHMLHETLKELPEDFREIIILRELEDLSYNEIAQILGCAVGTVMSRLSRARDKLRACLQQHSDYTESAP